MIQYFKDPLIGVLSHYPSNFPFSYFPCGSTGVAMMSVPLSEDINKWSVSSSYQLACHHLFSFQEFFLCSFTSFFYTLDLCKIQNKSYFVMNIFPLSRYYGIALLPASQKVYISARLKTQIYSLIKSFVTKKLSNLIYSHSY